MTTAFFLISFNAAINVLTPFNAAGIQNLKNYRNRENDATDVLFLGSSAISCNVEFSELWKEFGIASYCLGAGGATFYDDYYRLLESLKVRTPGFVIVEVQSAYVADEYGSEEFKTENITGFPPSLNKARFTQAAVESEQRLDYFLTFPLYHSRYTQLNVKDFVKVGMIGPYNKGQWTIFAASSSSPMPADVTGESRIFLLSQKQEYYLRKLISLCREKEIPLLLLKTPDPNREKRQPFYNAVGVIAREYDVPYLNMNLYDREIGLTATDIYVDNYHLNISGARKCAVFLGNYLRGRFRLPDHRGAAGYETWDLYAADREDQYIRIIGENNAYFAELARDGRTLLLIPYKIPENTPPALQAVLNSIDALPHQSLSNGDVSLQGRNLAVRQNNESCEILLEGRSVASVSSPGALLVVYDELLGQLADIAAFSSENNGSLKHLYSPA